MITDLLMTGAGLPFDKPNGMMVIKKFLMPILKFSMTIAILRLN